MRECLFASGREALDSVKLAIRCQFPDLCHVFRMLSNGFMIRVEHADCIGHLPPSSSDMLAQAQRIPIPIMSIASAP
jgi:hypothetical protein